MKLNIVIADDHPIFRSGLKFLLESSFPDIAVVDFENGALVLDHLAGHSPEIVLLDIDMPVKNGLDTCEEISRRFPDIRVVMLSMYKDPEVVKLAFFNGAKGYLVKDNTSEELVECIQTIIGGKTYLAKDIRDFHLQRSTETHGSSHLHDQITSLTATELKVLKLVSQKYSSKEIADLLFVSSKSVDNYRSRICKKLNLDARNNSLLMWVMEHKSILDSKAFN